MNVPEKLLYTKEHEWVRIEGDSAVIGISDHAQSALGDITFVELPKVGATAAQSKSCATVESVKAASDVYAPVSGAVIKVNADLAAHPEFVNQSPYEKGWFAVIKLSAPQEKNALMDAKQYAEYLKKLEVQ